MERNRWMYAEPESVGIRSEWILDFLHRMEAEGAELHGIVIIKDHRVILEAYASPYSREIPHIMHSFTKCLTNTAVGLAYSRGLLRLEDPILHYFPEYESRANAFLKKLTIRDLLDMRSGQVRPIGGNEWRPLETSWIDAYFQVEWDKAPGSKFMYSSGNSYILSAIVQKVSGMSCDLYLKENMTNQMGCGDFTWMKSPEGICSGGNGAMLCVEDMAAIGQVYLDRGLWNGKRLLCEEWVDLALGKKKPTPREKGEPEYNFHWRHSEKGILVSRGMFGQVCCLIPELNMTAAFTAADKKYAGDRLFQECIVYPALAVEKKAEADAVNDGGKVARILRLYASRMTLEGKPEHAIRPKPFQRRYRAEAPVDTITEAAIEVTDQELLFSIRDERGIHTVRHGLNTWKHGVTSMTGRYLHHQYEFASMKISAQASWMDKDHLLLEWRYPEMAFFDTVQIAFSGDGRICMKRQVNMNSEDTERPQMWFFQLDAKESSGVGNGIEW